MKRFICEYCTPGVEVLEMCVERGFADSIIAPNQESIGGTKPEGEW